MLVLISRMDLAISNLEIFAPDLKGFSVPFQCLDHCMQVYMTIIVLIKPLVQIIIISEIFIHKFNLLVITVIV